jgi:hypothetical protein
MKTLKVEAVYLMDYETCRTPGSNGAVRSFCRTRRCIRSPNGAVSASAAPMFRLRSASLPHHFDGRVGHARLREVISECFRLGRRRSGAAPLRVSEAIAHLGKAIEMADKAGEGAPRAPRPYCQASG